MKRLLPLLLLPLLASCIIHVDAGDNPEVGAALTAWRHPGFRALADDLDHAGWDIEHIGRRGQRWELDLEGEDGRQSAQLEVELGPGRGYRIRMLEIDSTGSAGREARERLRALVDPDQIEQILDTE